VDENAEITSKIGQLRTSGNVEIVDGMQGVNPLEFTLSILKNSGRFESMLTD
jgi:hypothetical protein